LLESGTAQLMLTKQPAHGEGKQDGHPVSKATSDSQNGHAWFLAGRQPAIGVNTHSTGDA